MATKTAPKTGIAGRIERLRALAEHPNTPVHEAELARHALARILKAHAETVRSVAWVPNWHGEKWQETQTLGLTEIATRIRNEIKLLRKLGKQAANVPATDGALKLSEPIGDAPASIKIGIRQLHYGSFKIWVKGIPQEWGWVRGERNGYPCWLATDALKALGQELRNLGNAYNYDNGDIMTDYFDRRYYLSVDAFDPDDTTYASCSI